ncbi:Uncharacterised protein [Citrobacter koseri]|nr:Uncharacterised protein [Citrobacter koseri]
MKKLIMILIPLALSGCAAVQYNDGKTVSIQSDGWYGLDSLQKLLMKHVSSMERKKQHMFIVLI